MKIGHLDFPTKAAAERYIRALLEEHRPASNRTPLSPDGAAFAASLLDLHPHRDTIVGPGIAEFYCQLLPDNNLRFLAKRIDGTYWDFSWRHCISPQSNEKWLFTVLRNEIAQQIEDYRATLRFPVKCAVTGLLLNRAGCHIDHEHPFTFKAIAEGWLLATGYSPDSIEIRHKQHYGDRPSIDDRTIAKQWQTYHRSYARLRPVSIKANLSTLRKTK